MYISSCSIRSWNWNRKLTQDHFLIEHWIQRTQRCPAARCWPWVYSLVLVSRYSTVRSETLTWREWGLWLNRFSRYFLWWQKSGNKVSLKSENLPNSPNKMSDKCYGMKFDLFDDQLLLKRHPTAQFNRWAKMGVVCNHVRNAALNGSNQFTPRQLFFNHVN